MCNYFEFELLWLIIPHTRTPPTKRPRTKIETSPRNPENDKSKLDTLKNDISYQMEMSFFRVSIFSSGAFFVGGILVWGNMRKT